MNFSQYIHICCKTRSSEMTRRERQYVRNDTEVERDSGEKLPIFLFI
jgi:hypothetical protein